MKLRHHFATISTALIASGCASEANAPAENEGVSAVQSAESSASIAVTTTGDSGAGSLRDALTRANAAAGADTIVIQVVGTITITSPLPYVTDAVTIVGPGADKVTIKAAPQTNFGIFGTGAAFGISGVTLSGGRQSDTFGGAINGSLQAPLTIADTVFSDNEAMIGAAVNANAPTTITRSKFVNHKGGSVIAIGDTATVTDTVVANNASTAILFTALKTLTVERSTLSGNAGQGLSGGAIHQRHGHVDVINSTLSGNSSSAAGDFWVEQGSLNLLNVTATDSAAPAIKRDATSTITARNTIFAGTGNRCADTATLTSSLGGNLSSDSSCTLSDPTDKVNTTPLLGALADNGGFTPTRALLEGSPAINAGVAGNLPATDQRGKPRTMSGRVDIGAYEFEPPVRAPIAVTTTGDSGAGSLRDALTRANAAAGADTIVIQVVGTITIASPLPYVTDAVTIVGPGADKVTIKAAPQTNFGIFGTGAAFGISGVTLSGGRHSDTFGGAINGSLQAPLTIADTVFSDNEAMIGAAVNANAPTTITRSRFVNHKGGSVIAIGDTATVTDTVVANNASTAILFTALKTLTVERSTLSGNAGPALSGGAIHLRNGHVDVINSTLSGNSSRAAGDFWVEQGSLNLLNVTATDSAAPAMKRDASSTITARNTIFAGTGNRCADAATMTSSLGGNLSSDSSCTLSDPTDKVNTTPLLGALADNGGFTPTRALLEGSPAINAGVAGNLPATDQRGKPRTVSGRVDIGAYEFEPSSM